ncbi:MAG: protein yqgE [Chitinophagaceae bacterium]|jgi:putative transcriptional regulator|nr:protein yqgE [Chitinophagaceae bacterium]
MVDLVPGLLLISDPFLKDPNFMRTVILLCEHQDEGSFGFVLNRPYDQPLGELISDLEGTSIPVYYGGPVQVDTVHFLHKRPDLVEGGFEITDGIFWGGDFEEVSGLIRSGKLKATDIRFYIGYSGWGEGQLSGELKEKSWITREGTSELVFHTEPDLIWKEALKDLGGEYTQMTNYPIDPQLN